MQEALAQQAMSCVNDQQLVLEANTPAHSGNLDDQDKLASMGLLQKPPCSREVRVCQGMVVSCCCDAAVMLRHRLV